MLSKDERREELAKKIEKLNAQIEVPGCRQMRLLDIDQFVSFCRKNRTFDFRKPLILKLWQLGFIKADIIEASTSITLPGINCFHEEENLFLYTDGRGGQQDADEFSDLIAQLATRSSGIKVLFHPFRCYVLNSIKEYWTLTIPEKSIIEGFDGNSELEKLLLEKGKWSKKWAGDPRMTKSFMGLNDMVALCVVAESSVHHVIYHGEICNSNPFLNYETIIERLRKLKSDLDVLFREIGDGVIESYHREICKQAERIDPNRDLHLIVRLMNNHVRKSLSGNLSAAMLFLSMAETLRRNLERAFDKKYPEEDECGFAEVFSDAKIELQGSSRVLDGDRTIANQFLRRFGLDYGVRANIYVEGSTEFAALLTEFHGNSSILLIDLKGAFVEKHGKGVYFRESLQNDITAKIFSLIILDSDKSENYRAVRQAARDDQICGKFFISNPDFEMENFTTDELAEIAYRMAQDNGLQTVNLPQLQQAAHDVKSAKELFEAFRSVSSELANLGKGRMWGEYLWQYARNHPRGETFGDKNDRLLNQIITLGHGCCRFLYETTRRNFKVDQETGDLIQRV